MGKSWLLALFPATMTTMTMMAYFTVTTATPTSASPPSSTTSNDMFHTRRAGIEEALDVIEAASTGSLGEDCAATAGFKSLPVAAALDPRRYDTARQKADMTALMLQNFGTVDASKQHVLSDALAKSLLMSVSDAVETRIIALNASTGTVINAIWLERSPGSVGEPKVESHGLQPGSTPNPNLPWFENSGASTELRSPKFMLSPPIESYRGWWTIPYFSCKSHRWLISYSINIRPPDARHGVRDFLSVDIDISGLEVNQCDAPLQNNEKEVLSNQIISFRGTHKCHNDTTQCEYQSPYNVGVGSGWTKGAYVCKCRKGYYSTRQHRSGFDGILVEAAWKEMQRNVSDSYAKVFRCVRCAPGCASCKGPEPCLATYNWPFRITLLSFSIFCVFGTIFLVAYMYKHRKLKVFKVASPIFLSITLLGCAIMYLEMAAIFPVLDMYSCIATKWTRHLGFCISYTALLMKTWRVSLTYRVKSAHKVKLTDKQLLQWMVPILLVMLIYLGTWTLSAPPYAEVIADNYGLKFYQCSFNWWDHSLAIGEIMFLAWGIKVCYNVRNAESLFNEARLISYAIYNIAAVNINMIAIHLFIFPHAGPDIKYLLGFLRTQLSTSVTVFLVFAPKMIRVLRGQGDQWDSRARARGVTASFSLNRTDLVPEEATTLIQENEELMEEIQKLAAQIEYMKIVHMQMYNRHIKPKAGGYFSTHGHGHGHPSSAQSPIGKNSTASFILKTAVERGASAAAAAAVEDSTFPSGSLHRARRTELLRERKAEREREREKEREKERGKEMEREQEGERQKEKERQQEKDRETEREREREKERQKEKEKKEKEKERERERAMENQREMEREREKQKEKEREREKQKEKEREREKEKENERERQKEKERERERDMENQREMEREREKQKEKEREREKQKEREREKEKENEREKEKEKEKEREREKKRERNREKEKEKESEREKEKEREREKEKGKERGREEECDNEKEKNKERERRAEKKSDGEKEKNRRTVKEAENGEGKQNDNEMETKTEQKKDQDKDMDKEKEKGIEKKKEKERENGKEEEQEKEKGRENKKEKEPEKEEENEKENEKEKKKGKEDEQGAGKEMQKEKEKEESGKQKEKGKEVENQEVQQRRAEMSAENV